MARYGRRRSYRGFAPYVPVAVRRGRAAAHREAAKKRGVSLDPVIVEGRKITTTVWGNAWCDRMDSFHDFQNRLPRGRTYVRNGSVVHLEIEKGLIRGQVMGSRATPYEQTITIAPCKRGSWAGIVRRLSGRVSTLVELLEGRIADGVMQELTRADDGLLPLRQGVDLDCSCPDWATLCKHLAAVLYGVGARLDQRPELLFTLRGVSPADLIETSAGSLDVASQAVPETRRLDGDLGAVFGIELADQDPHVEEASRRPKKRAAKKRAAKKRTAKKRTAKKTVGRARKAAPSPASSAPRRAPGRGGFITRADLISAGVPAGTISTWLFSDVLLATEIRGRYRHTPESRRRLRNYEQR